MRLLINKIWWYPEVKPLLRYGMSDKMYQYLVRISLYTISIGNGDTIAYRISKSVVEYYILRNKCEK